MAENKSSKVMQDYEKVNRLIDGLTLFDDDLMSRVFDKNIEATELILRIILGRKITVIRVNGQEEVRNAEVGGRNITLDVYAMDENGQEMDIEVQGNSEGAHIRRARYHSSVLDSKMLKEGQPFICDLYLQARQVQKRVTGIPYRPIYKRDRGNLRGRITYRICKREL